MYASVRVYHKISDFDELVRKVEAGFVPILQSSPGFQGYSIVRTGENAGISIGYFESEDAARNSHLQAAAWVKENLAALIQEPPEPYAGEVVYQSDH